MGGHRVLSPSPSSTSCLLVSSEKTRNPVFDLIIPFVFLPGPENRLSLPLGRFGIRESAIERGSEVVVRLPAERLADGDYELPLEGVSAGGEVSAVGFHRASGSLRPRNATIETCRNIRGR